MALTTIPASDIRVDDLFWFSAGDGTRVMSVRKEGPIVNVELFRNGWHSFPAAHRVMVSR